jgi:hypothetical protein
MNHLALNEDSWIWERVGGQHASEPWASVDWDADPDWEWRTAADLSGAALRERWLTAVELSRQTIAGILERDPSLGQPARAFDYEGESVSLRWILTHLIEEYARHNGHADLLRESIDGATGE